MIAGTGTAASVRSSRSVTRATAAGAGALQLAGLGAVLAGSGTGPAIVLGAAGVVVGIAGLAPSFLAAVRRHPAWLLVLAVAVWWVAIVIARVAGTQLTEFLPDAAVQLARTPVRSVLARPLALAAIVVLTAAGLALVSDAVRLWLGLAPRQRAPWRQLTEIAPRPRRIAERGLGGAALIGLAAFLAIGFTGPWVAGSPVLQVLVVMGIAVLAMMVIGTPVAVGALMRIDLDQAGTARELERQRFAAHLHDSVLQTLALVQRQAHDPIAVARLARRQEHALRAWMAGESELHSETLGAALRDIVAEVEDEHTMTIELTAIGDRPLDPAGEALAAAAREALRNAARHAPETAVYVFAEMTARGAEVFIRDDGPGFDSERVAPERRGIRDAIVGRMASAGGAATVESTIGEGTEVALRIGDGRSR